MPDAALGRPFKEAQEATRQRQECCSFDEYMGIESVSVKTVGQLEMPPAKNPKPDAASANPVNAVGRTNHGFPGHSRTWPMGKNDFD